MAIVKTDLKLYGCASQALDDTSTLGGAVSLTTRLMDGVNLQARERLEVVSASASDITQTVTIKGRGFGGHPVSEEFTLNGTTAVVGKVEFYVLLDVLLSGAAVGTVSVRKYSDNSVIESLLATELRKTTLFKLSVPYDGESVTRYDKFFFKNEHGSLALQDTIVRLYSDLSLNITFGIAATVDDSLTTATRIIAPTGITFATTDVDVGSLAFGETIGIWVKQTLTAKDFPIIANVQPRILLIGGTAA